ncbi:Predicted nucleic acid-binding protein, contains PIN domain [Marivirga sericea]|uniref:Predicted nucleic acid-binding protein, contains PIN domain n=1 Tax=Marivirga sericea TaxID=1028 RepID=A0A1X7LF04_9BACT|nr:PIN domain-containing protein [Marivirga sericea]SMG52094.1 Predicted nucleic acid-binding protein, contains PIN domain [Marivirga sericea]
MKIVLDTNIILDIALKRTPFYEDSAKLISKIGVGKLNGFITATTITDIYYIAKKSQGHDTTISFITSLLTVINVLGVDSKIILKSLKSEIRDFEYAIQANTAYINQIDYLITRNKKDFIKSDTKVLSPTEFLVEHG